ncbi:short-chain collagen C4-like [Dreissena polymorpha]|uniref:Short-chain collagen C4 n=1 Tax=Dreissena polymorpha TaxID=45954 RepID=A0A9D4JV39_DREPO|nr:short-chain collagen C4-like [Dreissena polymorpha]KAH3825845.1 hypothetical protein DPMN_127728 [Dreissena polymorpha]
MILGLVGACMLLGAQALEPKCVNYNTNRFEYEHNVIEKLIYLEQFKSENAKKMQVLEQQVQGCITNSHQTSATYVHWGKKTCPNVTGTTQVYTGQAAGGHSSHAGSGEYICLPSDPEYDQYNSVADTSRSLMYGAEYEIHSNPPAFNNLNQNDVACSVCLAGGKSTLMIPGRTSCYSGWTKEYQGYLMGEHYTHQGKGYVCMDKNAEPLHSSFADLNGALFYLVEGRCGTLKCPPYVEGREIACVVCSIRT